MDVRYRDLDRALGSGEVEGRFEDPIQKITEIRTKNNECWMNLLRLAVKAAPEEAKAILAEITKNDREVTEWMTKL